MSADDADEAAARREAIHTLDRLVGTWALDGPDSSGTVSYDWYEGEAFLVQSIDLVGGGEVTRGQEFIGWDPDTKTLRSHFFARSGEILEYTYALTGDTLTIWFGGTDSPARYVGTFDNMGNRVTGAWKWPGGGYESNMTRVEREAGR